MGKTRVIDGVTYVEVERKAEVGERVIDKSDGEIAEVLDLITSTNSTYRFGVKIRDNGVWIDDSEYYVLEPLTSNPDITDILANLARRVSSLEQQLSSTQSNVEKLAEELANTKHRVSKHATMFGIVEERVGMLTDDIITLDERSQVLNAINKFYEEGSR
jgi:hypothetical protein